MKASQPSRPNARRWPRRAKRSEALDGHQREQAREQVVVVLGEAAAQGELVEPGVLHGSGPLGTHPSGVLVTVERPIHQDRIRGLAGGELDHVAHDCNGGNRRTAEEIGPPTRTTRSNAFDKHG